MLTDKNLHAISTDQREHGRFFWLPVAFLTSFLLVNTDREWVYLTCRSLESADGRPFSRRRDEQEEGEDLSQKKKKKKRRERERESSAEGGDQADGSQPEKCTGKSGMACRNKATPK